MNKDKSIAAEACQRLLPNGKQVHARAQSSSESNLAPLKSMYLSFLNCLGLFCLMSLLFSRPFCSWGMGPVGCTHCRDGAEKKVPV